MMEIPSAAAAGGTLLSSSSVGGGAGSSVVSVGTAGKKTKTERRPPRSKRSSVTKNRSTSLLFHPIFLILFALLMLALGISFFLVLSHPDFNDDRTNAGVDGGGARGNAAKKVIIGQQEQQEQRVKVEELQQQQVQDSVQEVDLDEEDPNLPPHLHPKLPLLPVFAEIPNAEQLRQDTLAGKPTMAGIAAVLNFYLQKWHAKNVEMAQRQADIPEIIDGYFQTTKEYLGPLEDAYRGKNVFPVREDASIFISLAAFREHLLSQTLESAFEQAAHPERLFIGAVVQNCFGLGGVQCKTGVEVIGKNERGQDMTKISDAPPDKNGIELFCANVKFAKYCQQGHIRVIYVHDTDALGPATARYYASKLWGGETYFMQMDSHLEFAPRWDDRYIQEVKATLNYPKSVLSSYPPGFQQFGHQYEGGTPGARLCVCEFSQNGVENHIIRINVNGQSKVDAPRPTQIAFIAAGFFFAHATFIKDVPFDPYVPWCFMGEEIALSIRAWTSGWNIYAPRTNLIAHQYRPGRLGLPKFWESVGRDSGRPNLNTRLQKHVLRRIKHMVGYPTDTPELIEQDGDGIVLTDYQHYALGNERTHQAYLDLTNINVEAQTCSHMQWCVKGEME